MLEKILETEIYRVKLPVPFPLKYINSYVTVDEKGWYVIDTGINYPEGRDAWDKVALELGLKWENLKTIYLTHYHPDHYGLAGYLQQKSRARVYMAPQEFTAARGFFVKDIDETYPKFAEFYLQAGVPEEKNQEILFHTTKNREMTAPHPEVTFIAPGQKVPFGKYLLTTYFHPGHSPSHLTLHLEELGLLFSGDHLLERISSNISYWPMYTGQNPLQDYFKSLEALKNLKVDLVLPGHGSPFTDMLGRIDELFAHHEERLKEIKKLSSEGLNPYEITLKIFGENLSPHEIRFAVAEVIAHQIYLKNQRT